MSNNDVLLSYAVETEAGVRPSAGYVDIPMSYVREQPELCLLEPVGLNTNWEVIPIVVAIKDIGPSYLVFKGLHSPALEKVLTDLILNERAASLRNASLWFRFTLNKTRQAMFVKGHALINGECLQKTGMYELRIVPESSIEYEEIPVKAFTDVKKG